MDLKKIYRYNKRRWWSDKKTIMKRAVKIKIYTVSEHCIVDKEVEAQHFPKTIQWKWCWSSGKRRKESIEIRKQMMAHPSVFILDPQKTGSISYMCELMNWAHGFLMTEAGTHAPCRSVISPLPPPFLVYQEPLLLALGTAVCGLGRFFPLPSLLTFHPGLPPICVFLVWNEICIGGGPVYASQGTLSINHVARRCRHEYQLWFQSSQGL